MKMQTNIGKMDAGLRYILGFILLAILLLMEGPWRWVGLLGIIPIATAVVNFCPVWKLFGINTSKEKHAGEEPRSRAL